MDKFRTCLTILMMITTLNALTPRICQTQRNGQFYLMNNIEQCNDLQVTKVTVEIEVANVEVYKTEAKGLIYHEKYCDTYEDFFGVQSREMYTKNIMIPEHQAKEMIRENKCLTENGDYRYSRFNENYNCVYSYLKHERRITTSCFFSKGFVLATHSGKMTSSITDVSGCKYNSGFCKSGTTSVVWSPNDSIIDEYTDLTTINCTRIGTHIICDSIAKSYDLNKFVFDKDAKVFINGLWKIKIISEEKTPNLQVSSFLEAETDLGRQLEALKSEVHARFQYIIDFYSSPQGRLNQICVAILQNNKITKSSLSLYATQFAHIVSKDANVVARATTNYLAIWPCRALERSTLEFQKLDNCYNMIPVISGNMTGFLDEQMIFHSSAVKVNCDKAPIKMFELEETLYIQRQNHLPFKVNTENFNTISFFGDFNLTGMPSLPEDWVINPEVFDVSTGLFDNMKEQMEEAQNREVDRTRSENTHGKLNIFGIRSLSLYGIIDAIITWMSRFGGIIAFYLLLKDQCQNNNRFQFLRRDTEIETTRSI